MDVRIRNRNEAESAKRIAEAQRRIDDKFLARPIRVLPIEARRERDRNRPFLEKMGDVDHLLNNAFKAVGRKIRQKLDMTNEVDIVHASNNIAPTSPRYKTQFNFNWDSDYSQELQMNILEGLKQKYFNWCVYHTYEEIMDLGRPNWWGLSLEEQHRNSPKYIDKILEQASIAIEEDLYTYRLGYMEQIAWADTSFGDITGGANGEPPYLDPARCKLEGKRYTGPDLNNPRNARIFTGPGIIYNTRLYNTDGSLTHVEPIPRFHFLAIGSLEPETKIDVANCIEFRRREMELEEQGILDEKDRLPAQWGLGRPDDFYKQIKIPFENSKRDEVLNYELEDIIRKREEIKRVYRLDTRNPVLQTRPINGVRNREYCNPFDTSGRNRDGGTFTPNRNRFTAVFSHDYTQDYLKEDRKPHPLEFSRDYINHPNKFHRDEFGVSKTTVNAYKEELVYADKDDYDDNCFYDEDGNEILGNIEDLGMPTYESDIDRAEIMQALGQCLPDEYDKNDPMAIERLRARLRKEDEEHRLREIQELADINKAKEIASSINHRKEEITHEDLEDMASEALGLPKDYSFDFNNFTFKDLDTQDEVSADEREYLPPSNNDEVDGYVEEETKEVRKPEVSVKTSGSIMEESDFQGYVEYNMSIYKRELLETLATSGPGEVFRVLQKFRGYAFAFHDGRFINEMKSKGTVNFNETTNRRNRFKSRKFIKEELGYFPVFMLVADGKLLDDYEYFLKTYNKCVPSGTNFLFVSEIKDDDMIIDANKWQDLERYIDTGVDNNEISKYKTLADLEYVERDDCELVLRRSLDAEDVVEIYDVSI